MEGRLQPSNITAVAKVSEHDAKGRFKKQII